MTTTILNELRGLFKSERPPIIYPSSGTGAAEAALVNCLSPGDTVVAFDNGYRSPFRGIAGTGSPGPRRQLRRLAIAGALSLAVAAGAVTALVLQAGAGNPGRTGPVRLAAWTVTKQPDGVLRIYMRQLRDPAGLRALLLKDGAREDRICGPSDPGNDIAGRHPAVVQAPSALG